MHEIAHYSSVKLGTTISSDMNSDMYAKEEIVAEITSYMLASSNGIPYSALTNNAVYIKTWLNQFEDDEINKIKLLMNQGGINAKQRGCIQAALDKAEETGAPAAAIELCDGRIVTGKTSSLLGASSAALINAVKALAGIDKDLDIISHEILEPVQKLKIENLGNHNPRLHTDEVLVALAITAATSQSAKDAMDVLKHLKGAELHSTVILSPIDTATFRKLGVNLTCEAVYQTKKLYHGN